MKHLYEMLKLKKKNILWNLQTRTKKKKQIINTKMKYIEIAKRTATTKMIKITIKTLSNYTANDQKKKK